MSTTTDIGAAGEPARPDAGRGIHIAALNLCFLTPAPSAHLATAEGNTRFDWT